MTTTTPDSPAAGEKDLAWPFVVTRKRFEDWQPMVSPRFMIARGGEHLLVHASDPGDAPCPSPVFERVVTSRRYGDLTLVAKSLPATADLIGGSPEEQLRDQAGRPIQLIEGLVLRGRHPGAAALWESQLASVDEIAHQAFPKFWRSEDGAASIPSIALAGIQPQVTVTGTEPGATAQSPEGEAGTDTASADGARPGITGRVSPERDERGKAPVRVMITAILVIAGMAARRILLSVKRRADPDRRGS